MPQSLQRPACTAAERAERRREYVRYFTILLVLAAFCFGLSLLTGCTRPAATAEQRAERAITYTDAAGWEVPLPADTARATGW